MNWQLGVIRPPFPLAASPLIGDQLDSPCLTVVGGPSLASPPLPLAGEPTAVAAAAAAACHPPTDRGSSRPAACRTPTTDHRAPGHVTRQRARIGPTDAGVTRSAGVAVPCVRRRGNCYVMASREEEGVGSRGRPLAGAAALREEG